MTIDEAAPDLGMGLLHGAPGIEGKGCGSKNEREE
jgi:hypothetical protein